ncbi:hypothetical protein T4E_9708 [Trichinella pseudospiralis]|uniref:Uncharacterized protein n=1 Tax=Trichinella pseudospiralis TaxID=6337 RepID=A0A0V0XVL9_TRIPS|nr:hypothetical protein T4E_9708 [Trichinella pseudospiralis]
MWLFNGYSQAVVVVVVVVVVYRRKKFPRNSSKQEVNSGSKATTTTTTATSSNSSSGSNKQWCGSSSGGSNRPIGLRVGELPSAPCRVPLWLCWVGKFACRSSAIYTIIPLVTTSRLSLKKKKKAATQEDHCGSLVFIGSGHFLPFLSTALGHRSLFNNGLGSHIACKHAAFCEDNLEACHFDTSSI